MKYLVASIIILLSACKSKEKQETVNKDLGADTTSTVATATKTLELPVPYATPSVKNYSKVIGWGDKKPTAPEGFVVTKFADSLDNPRWIYQGPNGDIFIAESNTPHSTLEKVTGENKSADRITLLRDADKDGNPELRTIFLK